MLPVHDPNGADRPTQGSAPHGEAGALWVNARVLWFVVFCELDGHHRRAVHRGRLHEDRSGVTDVCCGSASRRGEWD